MILQRGGLASFTCMVSSESTLDPRCPGEQDVAMDEIGHPRVTRRKTIQFTKPNRRMAFALMLVAALLSVPGSLCAQVRQAEGEKYLLLSDGSIHNGPPPSKGLYVRGTVSSSNVFRPFGNVEGEGAFADQGIPGWLELSRQAFVREDTGATPYRPCVKGFLGPDNIFRPQTREVVY